MKTINCPWGTTSGFKSPSMSMPTERKANCTAPARGGAEAASCTATPIPCPLPLITMIELTFSPALRSVLSTWLVNSIASCSWAKRSTWTSWPAKGFNNSIIFACWASVIVRGLFSSSSWLIRCWASRFVFSVSRRRASSLRLSLLSCSWSALALSAPALAACASAFASSLRCVAWAIRAFASTWMASWTLFPESQTSQVRNAIPKAVRISATIVYDEYFLMASGCDTNGGLGCLGYSNGHRYPRN